ncbi:Phosphoribosyl 1,2-cyclic phosphodiesterase [bacterium A37T11]|nr:Phosphoribosyl 1,2-cyclic phosphodiesterase [bacterium A37T11]
MALHLASLNSGSNGNCYYIGNEQDAVLVDAGISCRETENRMARLGLSMQRVRAIFISHEHSDHIKGLCSLARKYRLPVYISDGTLHACRFEVPPSQIHSLTACQQWSVGQLTVTSFSKYHDAAEPHSFVISQKGIHVGVFTDIGRICEQTIHHFSQCHAAFLEANYDEEMLMNGRYPYFLKNRIRGGHGHLSNAQALELFIKYRSPALSHLLLAHLSRDNNDPERAATLFRQHSQQTEIVVASRYVESKVYTLATGI